jgi:hypothetical protein
MNHKMFQLYFSVASGIKFRYSTHQLFLRAPSPTHCSQYLLDTNNFMKTFLMYQGIGIVVEVPIQTKMVYDDKDLTDFQFGSSQESKIEPPLVIDSVWDCPPSTLSKMMMVRPSWAGAVVIALFPAIVLVLDSSSTVMHLRLCRSLQRGRTLSPVPACGTFVRMLSMP